MRERVTPEGTVRMPTAGRKALDAVHRALSHVAQQSALTRSRADCFLLAAVLFAVVWGAEVDAAGRDAGSRTRAPVAHVRVLVDVSGSMRTQRAPHRLQQVKRRLNPFLEGLRKLEQNPRCRLSVEVQTFHSAKSGAGSAEVRSVADCKAAAKDWDERTLNLKRVAAAGRARPWLGDAIEVANGATDTPLGPMADHAARALLRVGNPKDLRVVVIGTDGIPSCTQRCAEGAGRDPALGDVWCEVAPRAVFEDLVQTWPRMASANGQVCTVAVLPAQTPIDSLFAGSVLAPDAACPGLGRSEARRTVDATFEALLRSVERQACRPVQPCEESAPFYEVVAVGKDGHFGCSGVLLGPDAVLTARHCLPATEVLASEAIFQAGAHRKVVAVQLPPDPEADAALLRLDAAIDVPLRDWRRANSHSLPSAGVHVGFGAQSAEDERTFGKKHITQVDMVGMGCTPAQSIAGGCVPELEWSLVGSPGFDTCSGDSGGGLFQPSFDGRTCEASDGRLQLVQDWQLLAITSRSLEGTRTQCGAGGVYTRLDALRPWLTAVLDEEAL